MRSTRRVSLKLLIGRRLPGPWLLSELKRRLSAWPAKPMTWWWRQLRIAERNAAAARGCQKVRDGALDPDAIDEGALAAELQTADLPDLDLLIRTSGEVRLSNFLLWQAAYCEMLFTPVLWPDFDERALQAAIAEFAARQRRFGGR